MGLEFLLFGYLPNCIIYYYIRSYLFHVSIRKISFKLNHNAIHLERQVVVSHQALGIFSMILQLDY